MEHDPKPPVQAPDASPATSRRAAFYERWHKRAQKVAEAAPASEKPRQQATAEVVPPQPEKKSFGKNIMDLLRSVRPQAEQQMAPVTPEAPAPVPATPELTPQYDRATRMRRIARVIIANVLGRANAEPEVARQQGESQPLTTEPLVEAAQDLQSAAASLDATVAQAQTAPNTLRSSGGYDAHGARQPERSQPPRPLEQEAGDRIDRRLRRLEAAAEEHRAANVAVVGLGVLAVLLTGAEYFGRKRSDRKIRRDMRSGFATQGKAMNQQRAEFSALRDAEAAGMNRNQREQYYERLSTFTHQQAERAREADRELQEVVIPRAEAAPVQEGEVYERRSWQPRQPERRQPMQQQERERETDAEPQPLVRVETADRIERQPGRQTGSAGTGFFGGGGGGIAAGTGPSDLAQPRQPLDPNSPEARKLEELRRAEQARPQQNAWLYGAALIAAMGVLLIVTIVVG